MSDGRAACWTDIRDAAKAMRAHLKSAFCTGQGAYVAIGDYAPADPDAFGVQVQAFIASTEDGPPDSFDFVVCTPRWFADAYGDADLRRSGENAPNIAPLLGSMAVRQLLGGRVHEPTSERDPVVFATGLVFVRRWDAEKVEASLRDLCARAQGPDWGAVASRLGRLLPWEFHYRYDRAVDRGEPFPPPRPTPD